MTNLIIAGSRSFDNYFLLKREVDLFIFELGTTISIVCGMAKGADLLGYNYAKERNLNIIEMPANWDKHGKKAGYLRNLEMAKISDAAIVFWNGSKGTQHMINIMNSLNKQCKVIVF